MAQVALIFDCEKNTIPEYSLSDGFIMRPCEKADFDNYNALRTSVGFSLWNMEKFTGLFDYALPESILTIVEKTSGRIVSSATAATRSTPQYKHLGFLDWVMTDPEFRGRNLAGTAVASAMLRLKGSGFRFFHVTTEDHRLAALKLYIKLKWQPLIRNSDAEAVWQNIADDLDLTDLNAVFSLPL